MDDWKSRSEEYLRGAKTGVEEVAELKKKTRARASCKEGRGFGGYD